MVDELLSVSGVDLSSVLLDIGCGDGRVLLSAARSHGVRHCIGVEALQHVAAKACQLRDEAGLDAQRVEIHHTDFASPNNQILEDCLDRQWTAASAAFRLSRALLQLLWSKMLFADILLSAHTVF